MAKLEEDVFQYKMDRTKYEAQRIRDLDYAKHYLESAARYADLLERGEISRKEFLSQLRMSLDFCNRFIEQVIMPEAESAVDPIADVRAAVEVIRIHNKAEDDNPFPAG